MIAKRSEVLKGVQANMQGVVDLTLILRSFNANRHPQVQAPNVGNQFFSNILRYTFSQAGKKAFFVWLFWIVVCSKY